MQSKRHKLIDEIRYKAENDLETFIKVVSPDRVLGHVHIDLIKWWTRKQASTHQLALLPRDHQKSALIAYRVAWEITRNPGIRILYISATSNLATKQLYFIKSILTSPIYRQLWPEMINEDEAKRSKWTETEISVDHPLRKEKFVRDPTIFTAGLTTTITGLHCDIAVLDDVVVDENASTIEGRNKVAKQVSYLASISGTDSKIWVVGTRYHPKDLYNTMQETIVEEFGEEGDITDSYFLYEVFERKVEDRGDGTGKYLWPRMQTSDGRWFGFDQKILAKKRAQYHNLSDFRAQYYNDPNDASEAPIDPSLFQYYNPDFLAEKAGVWFYKGKRLNIFASIDFAYSLNKKADYSAIAVVGIDEDNYYYVLDLVRFKTNSIKEYFERILACHSKWNFRKIRAEITAAQEIIVKDLKENYLRVYNVNFSIDEFRPTRNHGNKHERIQAVLQAKYENNQIFHPRGGTIELLEQELTMARPPHDDLKDALASCVEICVKPTPTPKMNQEDIGKYFNSRFGGFTG